MFKIYMCFIWVLAYIAAIRNLSMTGFLFINGFVMAFIGFYGWETVQHDTE